MTLLFLFILTILAALFLQFRKTTLGLLIFLVAHLLLSGGGIFPHFALNDLQSYPRLQQPEWKTRNAIVILGFGTVKWEDEVYSTTLAYARLFEGLRLYSSCIKASADCKVLVSGGDPMGNDQAEASVMARELESAGVPRQDMIIEAKSNNTFQNARFSAPLIEKYDQIYLVTSGFHMKRAMLYFKHFVKEISAAPADRLNARVTYIPVTSNFVYFDFALHEYLGIIRYKYYNWMGWNPPQVKS